MRIRRWHVAVLVILLIASLIFSTSQIIKSSIQQDEIAIIKIEGEISNIQSQLSFQQHSTKSILENLDKANKNKNVKAIILVINSPGGTVLASKEIADYLSTIQKPKIAVIRDIGTSGAYWIASSSDEIIADKLSITGSIGVTSSYLEFSGLLDKLGIQYEQISVGQYKELGNPYQQLTQEEKSILDKKLSIIHEEFLKEIQKKRKLKNIERIKTGEFFLGSEALELGLIDKLGNLQTAIDDAKSIANIEDPKIVQYEEKKDLFNLLSQFSSQSSYFIGRGIAAELKQPNLETNYKFSA
ncbi:MAG TPA: signal peptide peptidase SppA [Candidatus Nanoarchaeia archaeon]|nr:signal peptide peptidase SppA [Candidatus Nanoarchaeia archaeon]